MLNQKLSQLEETQLDLELAGLYHADTILLLGAIDTITNIDSVYARQVELSLEDAINLVQTDETVRDEIYDIQATRSHLLCKMACHEAQIQTLTAELETERAKAWVKTEAFLEELLKETNALLGVAITDNELDTLDYGEPTKAGWRSERRLETEVERLEGILDCLRGK